MILRRDSRLGPFLAIVILTLLLSFLLLPGGGAADVRGALPGWTAGLSPFLRWFTVSIGLAGLVAMTAILVRPAVTVVLGTQGDITIIKRGLFRRERRVLTLAEGNPFSVVALEDYDRDRYFRVQMNDAVHSVVKLRDFRNEARALDWLDEVRRQTAGG